MTDLNKISITQATPMSDEEALLEAQAWGHATVEEFWEEQAKYARIYTEEMERELNSPSE